MTVAAIELGRSALARGAWEEARDVFEAAAAADETPEALEGLGTACRWLNDARRALAASERAYSLATIGEGPRARRARACATRVRASW